MCLAPRRLNPVRLELCFLFPLIEPNRQVSRRTVSTVNTDTVDLVSGAAGVQRVTSTSGVTEYRDMLTTIRSNVATLKKQGKSLSETIAAKPTAAYDAKYGQFLITPAFFTALVYSGV